MNISPLQVQRLKYSPKLPGMLRHGINEISVKEGEATQSVADQEKIVALFPNTYGKKEITFEKGTNTSVAKKQVVGVILSGGQAPGGHNVVCGLYDALRPPTAKMYCMVLKAVQADFWKIIIWSSMMNTSTSSETPAVSILSVPAEQNWKQKNSLR